MSYKMLTREYSKNDFLISTDQNKLELKVIHKFLENTYWAKDIPI